MLASMAALKLQAGKDQDLAAVLYVDGHVRAYQGTRKIGKAHSTRLKFPAPATVETWVSDANGDPVLVVMAEPGASLAMELRRLLPEMRRAVGDNRRILVGFDRGGWSPALFQHMNAQGFDVLTWRKGNIADIPANLFTGICHTDDTGRTHRWVAADTTADLPVGERKNGEVFTMRQITRLIDNGKGAVRQIHLLTTRTDLAPGELLYRMGSRWRQENHFRYARMHFDLDAHDSYTTSDDDPDRMVPNPAKKTAHQKVLATRARYENAVATTDAGLLAARTPEPGRSTITISNQTHNTITAPLRAAEQDHEAAKAAHRAIPTRIRLGDIAPDQLVLDTETKQLTHAIRIAAFNTVTALARDLRINTTYACANDEAHTLIHQILTTSGDIDPTIPGQLTIRLDPLPTQRATTAAAELCEHLTNSKTRYPGTNQILRYEIKNPT
ncbi:putative transposase [Arthrobacter sp. H5]|uniref:putative transposase n=1 Tax=Arthrobacter sp. H5 TaxID=1267973 RepID=UPI0031B8806C